MVDSIYFSPHPDDIILSCGGRLPKERSALIVNVFSKNYSGLTKWDKICGLKSDPMKKRIREDKKIISGLGFDSIYLDFYDHAVYRDIKETSRPKKEIIKIRQKIKKIIGGNKEATLIFPAGISHSDHLLLSKIGKNLKRDLVLYEDLPYGLNADFSRHRKILIGKKEMGEKINLILEYKTQIKGFLSLTNSKKIGEFKEKLINHHKIKDKFYEKIIMLNK